MTDKTEKPAVPVGDRHLLAEAMGVADKPKNAQDAEPNVAPAIGEYGGTEPLMTDEEFEFLDHNGDGVVHLHEIEIASQYGDLPPVKGKDRKAAPENKDAAALRDDKSDPEPTQLPADPPKRRK